jgi:hypothetical protein
MTCIYIQQPAKQVMFSESCNAASLPWYGHWNIKINKNKTQPIYFSHHHRLVNIHLTLKGQDIPFFNHIKYHSHFLLKNHLHCIRQNLEMATVEKLKLKVPFKQKM